MSKKVLAAPVLDMPNHLSTYLLVHALFCVWPHCLRALSGSGAFGHFECTKDMSNLTLVTLYLH